MKKIIVLLVCAFTFYSCDDGDLTLEEIDLTTEATVQACTSTSGVTLLFKINGAETVFLEVPSTLVINEATEDADTPRTADLNSNAFCYYRSFESNINSGYFCDEVPSDVGITLEYLAQSGTVEVITTENVNSDTMEVTYIHNINLTNVVFTGTNGQDVRYNVFDFGDFTTTQ